MWHLTKPFLFPVSNKRWRWKVLLWPRHPSFFSLTHTHSILSPRSHKMWRCTKNLTFKVPVGFESVVSLISRYLSSPIFLYFIHQQGWVGGVGRRVGPGGLGPCHCSCLSSVHEGTALIDFPSSFPVKQMAQPWLPLRGRPCHNRCGFSRISPPPLLQLSPRCWPVTLKCTHGENTGPKCNNLKPVYNGCHPLE